MKYEFIKKKKYQTVMFTFTNYTNILSCSSLLIREPNYRYVSTLKACFLIINDEVQNVFNQFV